MLHIPVVMETLMACLQLGVGDCGGGEAWAGLSGTCIWHTQSTF